MRQAGWGLALLLLAGCGERAVTAADVWEAARARPRFCEGEWCSGFTSVPPGALRADLGAPEWTENGADLSTVAGELRLEMRESVGGQWMLTVWPLAPQPQPDPAPAPEPAPDMDGGLEPCMPRPGVGCE